ncbi:hypothetical protein A3C96_02335 [Candidatus Uhrbacteria bacterium RIFCSPHIGHO2_02_FULL_60_10]|uniref:Peptidase M50 domain-containing protein n=1 Tax=Candidatus Uhrbacteria bacterium RIFCSPHIGHO2_02_FULL_60_10 TaxID=1802392 RepID=A0A1F7U706_9BACT|nr:MAG: hypothetical protein A3C96_02335 [Candidatus Uhrbacteria bacterium RIFCSPHIGHO2_02_FULL_60_10]
MGLIITLLVFTAIIFVHELGHFLVMRRCGVIIEEFSIGFGPRFAGFVDRRGTVWSLRLIPLGGYVKPRADGEGSLGPLPPGKRFLCFMAGMFMNAIAAFVTLLIMGYVFHRVPLVIWDYLKPLGLPTPLMPAATAFAGSFGLWFATPPLVVYQAVVNGLGLFTNSAGPIGIVQMGMQMGAAPTVGQAVMGYAFFFALMNTAVAGFNLLPIYPLDGGHSLECICEKLLGKARTDRLRPAFRLVGAAIMILLVIGVFASDIIKLIPH